MKKICSILSLVLIMVMISAPAVFAAGLNIVDTYPKDGGTGFEPVNMMVKLTFSDNVGEEKLQATNTRAFAVKDQSGKVVPMKVLYTPEDNTRISLLMSENLSPNTEYKVTIDEKLLVSSTGKTLSQPEIISFKTRDVAKDSQISTVMMFAMVGAMVAYTSWDTRRKAKKEAVARGDKVNPYKVAKEKGVSVDKVVASSNKGNKKNNSANNNKSSKNNQSKVDNDKKDNSTITQTGGTVKGKKPRKLNK